MPEEVGNIIYELLPGYDAVPRRYLESSEMNLIMVLVIASFAFGTLLYLYRLVSCARLVKRAEQVTSEDLMNLIHEVAEVHGLRDIPLVKCSDEVSSPGVFGLSHPVLVIPQNFEQTYPLSEQRDILDHELWHIRNRDLIQLNLFALIASLVWWNPLAKLGERRGIFVLEVQNDARFAGNQPTYSSAVLRNHGVAADPHEKKKNRASSLALSRYTSLGEFRPIQHRAHQVALILPLALIATPIGLTTPYDSASPVIGFEEYVFNCNATGEMRLWRMALDGRSPSPMHELFVGVGVPTISPDGAWIAYNRTVSGAEDIFVARVNGTGERIVVATKGRDAQPVWSPNGKSLAFCTTVSGKWEVAIADVSTGAWKFVTTDGTVNFEPTWHPSGSRLIFTSKRTGKQKLWSINTNGKDLRQLTFGNWDDTGGRYSADGRLIAYSATKRIKYDVLLLDLATGDTRVLTSDESLDGGEVRFSRAGRFLLMSTTFNGQKNIGRIDLDSGETRLMGVSPDSVWPATR